MNKYILLLISLLLVTKAEFINYEEDLEKRIAIITITRPKALNALNSEVLTELDNTLDKVDTSKIGALIITGDGEKSFVAGADIAEMSNLNKNQAKEFSKKGNDVFRKIEKFEIPIIAAVNGYALGGGSELSLSCDIRICSENAIFGQPEVGLGIIPGFGGTQRLSRIVGIAKAKQLIFSGKNIQANDALKIGLVNEVYPQKELLNEAKKMAESFARNGPNAVKISKKAINEGFDLEIDKAIQLEENLFSECFETSEQKEKMENFLNKNKEKAKGKKSKAQLVPTKIYGKNMISLDKDLVLSSMPALLTAGDKNKFNTMIINHASLGVGYNKPILTVYVKPERYTSQIMENTKYFTVTYIDKSLFNNKYQIYGVKSGRDVNKEEISGNHPIFMDNGGITYEEAVEVYVCKLIIKSYIEENNVDKDILNLFEKNEKNQHNLHVMYVGEIIEHYKIEKKD